MSEESQSNESLQAGPAPGSERVAPSPGAGDDSHMPCASARILEESNEWLAFRYVSGEMAPAEVAQFESLLANQQSAREAVAAAVLLTQAVALAGKGQPPSAQPTPGPAGGAGRRPAWQGRLAWALFGAAAALLFAWGLQSWRDTGRMAGLAPDVRTERREDLSVLAFHWTAAGEFDAEGDDVLGVDRSEWDEPIADTHTSPGIARDLFDDLVAPDWLLAAVHAGDTKPMTSPDRDPNG